MLYTLEGRLAPMDSYANLIRMHFDADASFRRSGQSERLSMNFSENRSLKVVHRKPFSESRSLKAFHCGKPFAKRALQWRLSMAILGTEICSFKFTVADRNWESSLKIAISIKYSKGEQVQVGKLSSIKKALPKLF